MHEPTTNWLSQLDSEEVVFASDRLGRTIRYLKEARTPGQGWGPYPKSDTDLHHTALVLQALYYSRDKSLEPTIADAASYIRKSKLPQLNQLTLEEVSDLLSIVRSEQRRSSEEYPGQLIPALEQAYGRVVESNAGLSIRELTSAFLAVLELGISDSKLIKTWSERLLQMQHPDGGWPNVSEKGSSIVATAMALQVLTRLTGEQASEALRRGLVYVRNQLEETTWKNIGIGGDTFSYTTVLRALAEIPMADYNWSKQGVDLLFTQMNADGSWGDGPGEPGNVESTAMCLLALAAAGQTRFVPARLAKVAIMEIQSQLNLITDQHDKLQQDFEKRVDEVSDNLFRERNELLLETENLKSRLKTVQEEVQSARDSREAAEYRSLASERELELLRTVLTNPSSRDSLSARTAMTSALAYRVLVFGIGLIVPILSLSWYLLQQPRQVWSTVVGIVLIILSVTVSGYIVFFWYEERRFGQRLFKYSDRRPTQSDIALLRRTFSRISAAWDPYVSEEVAYRLFNDITDMSPEIAERYTEDLATKLRLDPVQRIELLTWVGQVTRLDTAQRRVLLTQLQRSSIGLHS